MVLKSLIGNLNAINEISMFQNLPAISGQSFDKMIDQIY